MKRFMGMQVLILLFIFSLNLNCNVCKGDRNKYNYLIYNYIIKRSSSIYDKDKIRKCIINNKKINIKLPINERELKYDRLTFLLDINDNSYADLSVEYYQSTYELDKDMSNRFGKIGFHSSGPVKRNIIIDKYGDFAIISQAGPPSEPTVKLTSMYYNYKIQITYSPNYFLSKNEVMVKLEEDPDYFIKLCSSQIYNIADRIFPQLDACLENIKTSQ